MKNTARFVSLNLVAGLALLCAATLRAQDSTPPAVAITSATNDADVTVLGTVSGWATDNILVTNVTFVLRELDPSGGPSRHWNGSAWQTNVFRLAATIAGTNWSKSVSVALPPLNSGISYDITAIAIDSSSNSVSQTITIHRTVDELVWDPGTTHLGTEVLTNPHALGGSFIYKIITSSTTVGGWRSALNVGSNEANLYLRKGAPPTTGNQNVGSTRAGSDGFVLHSTQFGASEEWYYLVTATAGSAWNLVSGEPFVTDLGTLAPPSASGNSNVVMGAEGWRFFRTVPPAGVFAWRLWLNGATNSILVKKGFIPLLGRTEKQQDKAMLLVPDYLTGDLTYFVGVPGDPGQAFTFQSKEQPITDIAFDFTTNSVAVSGFPYTTYRVEVPINQIAWEVRSTVVSGDPNITARRGKVPNEFDNDAFSDVPGSVDDSFTLVPTSLSDGTFYITVYSAGNHTFNLFNGQPTITSRSFVGTTVNDTPNRTGWRYYVVPNVGEQIGYLGWELDLSNQVAGTEIALRRNAVPGRWNYRTDGYTYSSGQVDFSGTTGFLQRPGHQADIWYIGIYQAATNLGSFGLTTRAIPAPSVAFNGGSTNVVALPQSRWIYFRVDVPADMDGWDLRITSVAGGNPRMSVRRDLLPVSFGDVIYGSDWPNGATFTSYSDWTGLPYNADGFDNSSKLIAVGRNNPLQTGTYYVGIRSDSGSTSFNLVSRGIGTNYAIGVTNLAFSGAGSAFTNILAPREAAYYRIVIPSNSPNWLLRMTPTVGDSLLLAQRDVIPNVGVGVSGNVHSSAYGKKLQKIGKEHFLLLPEQGDSVLPAETNYLAVVSEGEGPNYPAYRIGSNVTTSVIESLGSLAITPLGTGALPPAGGGSLTQHVSLEAGQITLRQFTVPAGVAAMEVRLLNRVGNPTIALIPGPNAPYPHVPSYGGNNYGADGGWGTGRRETSVLTTIANPTNGTWTVAIKAQYDNSDHPDAECDVQITALAPAPVVFNGGTDTVSSQSPGTWRYYQVIVPTDALGWDVRLTNFTGDPQMVIRRDLRPEVLDSFGASYYGTDWPSGGQFYIGNDWTSRAQNADNSYIYYRLVTHTMEHPLSAGTYYIGVYSAGNTPANYTLLSRGIGSGYAIVPLDLNFSGAGAAHTNTSGLGPREAAYYRIVIPSNAPSWHVRVTPDDESELLLVLNPSVLPNSYFNYAARQMQKTGKELFTYFPTEGEALLPPGTNYLAVVSEGMNPADAGHTGTNVVTYRIESLGPVPVVNLGNIPLNGPPVSQHVNVEAGEVKTFSFTLTNPIPSVEVQLTNRVGNPFLAVRRGTNLPAAVLEYYQYYGFGGGWTSGRVQSTDLITLANAASDTYMLTVFGRDAGGVYVDGEADLVITPRPPTPLNFVNGSDSISGQGPQTWRFFQVTVPSTPDMLGWELRLTDAAGGTPQMFVRRDTLPADNAPGLDIHGATWPSGAQCNADYDWTFLDENNGTPSYGHYLAFGRDNPLEPGTYFVGVFNQHSSAATSYTLSSRGVGVAGGVPVNPLAFADGSATAMIAPRDVAYYQLEVPANTTNWQVRLDTSAGGEARLWIRKDHVPNIKTGPYYTEHATSIGKHLAKTGNEHFVVHPDEGQTNIAAGTYYLAVIGEGVNPPSGRIGTGSSTFTLESLGQQPVTELGFVPGVGSMISSNIVLEGGQTKAFRFNAAGGAEWVELRLANRIGNPALSFRKGSAVPYPHVPGTPYNLYGADGGWYSFRKEDPLFITIIRPDPTNTFTVKAEYVGSEYPDAAATIQIENKSPATLAYANGLAAGSLANNQRTFYRVVVPTGQIGWRLDLNAASGTPTVRVRKDLLPSDDEPAMAFGGPTLIIAPPFLEPGTWYVEVKGGGATDFTLTSNPVLLARPAWDMPAYGAPVTTPGLPPTGSLFGDTGVSTGGGSLPGDQGVDLGERDFHFYAITVPDGNVGLLRTELLAISGNPDLYIRRGGIPTFHHYEFGNNGGGLVDYELTGTVSEYGNWVPLNGRTETQLGTGTWYLSVRANASNARYRLKLSVGTITTLADGATLSGQLIPGTDWRYYRINVPSNAPQSMTVTYSQQQGDVDMFVRDTIPPGEPWEFYPSNYRRWSRDVKNGGPYPDFPNTGSYTLNVPTVRPNTAYYLGFRANGGDASFTVGLNFSGATIDVTNVVAFYGGVQTVTVPAFGTAKLRVPVPADATSWRHSNSHSSAVTLYLDQGTLPDFAIPFSIWNSGNSPDSQLIQYLYGWPWTTNQHYFFVATNTSGSPQQLTIRMDGRNAATDDTDGDGLPDGWEILYFGNLNQNASGDTDGDGVNNATELAEGTNPNNAGSFRPRLTVSSDGDGSVVIEPNLPSYTMGQNVTLTAVPGVGQFFNGWTGSVTNVANPLSLTMNGHRTLVAQFSENAIPLVFTNFHMLAGHFNFTVTGPGGSALVILASDTLTGWTPIATNAPFTGTFNFEDPATAMHTSRNYRVRLEP